MKVIPPIDPRAIPIIIEVGQKALELFTQWIEGKIKAASENKPLTGDSSANDFQEMNRLFTELQQQVGHTVQEMERKVILEIEEYFHQFKFLLASNPALQQKYYISDKKYEREIRRLHKQCTGFIENEVAATVNLMNPQVRELLMMLPGSKKEQALKNFIHSAIESALNNFSTFFEEEVAYLSTMISEDLQQQLTQVEKINSAHLTQLTILEDSFKEDEEKNEYLQAEAYIKLTLIKELENVMEK